MRNTNIDNQKITRVEVLGVPVDCLTMEAAISACEELLSKNKKQSVLAMTAEKVISAKNNPRLFDIISNSALLIPDGIGVVWAARHLGMCDLDQVAGCDLMPELCRMAEQKNYKVFLFGGSELSNRDAVSVLKEEYPELSVVGSHHGYVTEDNMYKVIAAINASGTDIVFVALGSPKQELWISSYLNQLEVGICQGVGGTFDLLSGRSSRAPVFLRKLYLEWLFALLVEPSIMPRITRSFVFVYEVLKAKRRHLAG